jgi:hypothetical protein
MINEHERAILTVDLPEYGLRAGDMGVVVHIHQQGAGYELEFFTAEGKTIDVITVEADQVRPASSREIMHARSLAD